ncbi:MAG: hypothetical protein ACLSCV_04805 [Acutalibacteraceae bacterium]
MKSADGCFIYIPVMVDKKLKNAKIMVASFYSDFNKGKQNTVYYEQSSNVALRRKFLYKREQKSIPSYGNAFDSYIMPKYKRSFDDDQS